MSSVSKLAHWANLLIYITLQLTVARVIVFHHSAFCFVYVAFLLLLPRRQQWLSSLLLLGFAVGLLVDVFYNSIGVHAFASVLMVYSRALLLKFMLPISSYEAYVEPTLSNLGWKRFFLFSLILTSIHHTALFLLSAGGLSMLFMTVQKIVFSTLLTCAAVLITQSMTLFTKKR